MTTTQISFQKLITVVITLLVVSISLSWFFFDLDYLTEVINSHYTLGILIYTLYVAASVIFVTFPIIPLFPFVLVVYGMTGAVLFTLLGVNAGAYIAFLVSRNLGRQAVINKIGEDNYDKYEDITSISSFSHFLLLRLIANNYFDIVSYIGGLSEVTHKDFLISTGFSSLVWIAFTFKLIERSLTEGKEFTLLTLSLLYLAVGAAAFFIVGRFFVKLKNYKNTD